MAGAAEEAPAMAKLAQLEKVPGVGRLAPRVKHAMDHDSPWLAWGAGVALGMPTPTCSRPSRSSLAVRFVSTVTPRVVTGGCLARTQNAGTAGEAGGTGGA
jgi:hypothetical protein